MNKRRVILLGEGPEEKEYLDRLKSIGIFSSNFEFIPESAAGITNISARYSEYYEDTMNYLVLIYCDTENNNNDYQRLKQDIDDYFGFAASKRLLFYVSPCTMMIVLNHFAHEDEDPIPLTKVSKTNSGEILVQHGVTIPAPPYDARKDQRNAIMSQITKANYRTMKDKIATFAGSDTKSPATNALTLFKGIEFGSDMSFVDNLVTWIDDQKKALD
jgi:hypothetical protein